MKKVLVIFYLLILLAAHWEGVYSQDVGRQSGPQYQGQIIWQTDTAGEQPAADSAPEVAGPGPYLTHPEFTQVMTTTVTTAANNTAEGYLFLGALAQFSNGPATLMILDDDGEPVYIEPIEGDPFVGDFRKQTVNGTDLLTYHIGSLPGGYTLGSSYILDNSYQIIDTWTIDNGNGSDTHEFLLLDNGHAIIMGYVLIPFDLTPYGGPADGTLVDIVLQEQDENKNVIFEWFGSDHLPIEDTEVELNTTNPVDYLHTNAIAVDNDGNWLLSHRNLSEITKISRQTGEVIWRMGGAGNEFTFTNDIGFFNQHNINRLDNGNITLFDNGTFHDPPHSRAVEYAIDEVAKTVTRVWMYPEDQSEYSSVMSNIQRFDNGNSLIGWGNVPKFTEVHSDGTIALEVLTGAGSYRVFRHPWSSTPNTTPRAVIQYDGNPTAVTFYTSWNGATDITGYDIYAGPTMTTLTLIDTVSRSGFETEIPLTALPADTCFFQTKPIHAQANPTPFSNLMYRLDLPVCWEQLHHAYFPVYTK